MLSAELHTSMLSFSSRLYRWMLLVYPRDLRSEFGCEIAETFDLQLSGSWRSERVRGVIRIWTRSVLEFLIIAVAYRAKLLTVPCISTVITAIIFSTLLAWPVPLAHDFASTTKPPPILVTRFVGGAPDVSNVVQAWGLVRLTRTPPGGVDHVNETRDVVLTVKWPVPVARFSDRH